MEFFDWMGIPQFILDFFNINCQTSQEVVDTLTLELLICLGAAALLYLLGHILGGFGLYKLAKRANIAHPWLGFIPVASTWLAGQLAGEASFFGQRMKRAGLYAALAETVYILFEAFVLVLNFLTLDSDFYLLNEAEHVWQLTREGMATAGLGWVYDAITYCNMLVYLPWLIVIMLFFVLYTAFFRKYYARNPFLMTFLCVILPVRGFVLFAVRNNAPVDYREYLRRRMGGYPHGNPPYGGYGPGAGSGGQNGGPQEEPFSDFGGPHTGSGGAPNGTGTGGEDDSDGPFPEF